MTKKKIIIFSVFAGLVAVFLTRSYISSKEHELLRLSAPIEVLVTARDIAEGTRLQDGMIEKIAIPKKFLQPDVLTNLEEVRDRVLTVPLLRGTQMMGSMLALNQNIGLAQKIPPGQQAITIFVDGAGSQAGLIQPGDFVDVAVTVEVVADSENNQAVGSSGPSYTSNTEMLTKTILNNLMVLAIGQRSYRSRSSSFSSNAEATGSRFLGSTNPARSASSRSAGTTVSLAVNREQVLALTLAQEIGDIALSLHSSFRSEENELEPNLQKKELGAYELLGISRPVVRNPVDVFYGARRKNN